MAANPNGAGINEAASRISGILSPEPEPTVRDETEEAGLEEELETQEGEELVNNPEADSDTEGELEKYTVKANGEELEVTLEDLTKSYMMESDYRQKTMKISDERKALELKNAEVSGKLAEMKSLIEFESSALSSDEMLELREIDPDEYLKRVDSVKAKAEKYKKFKADAEEKLQADRGALLLEEQQKLVQAVPDFLDSEKLKEETPKIAEQLVKLGYSNDEINNISDHRTFLLARKAMLYDRIMSQNPGAKQVNKAPKAAKPGSAKSNADRQSQAAKDDRARLAKTGHVRDAQKAIKNLLS